METGLIKFLNAELITAREEATNTVYVAMKPLVESMGLDWHTQYRKITEDERYRHMPIPYKTNGGTQEMLSLDAYHLPAFLYSINPNKVRKDLRERIIQFQSETFKVINDYWNKGAVINPRVIDGYKGKIAAMNNSIIHLRSKLEEQKLREDRMMITIREQDKTISEVSSKIRKAQEEEIRGFENPNGQDFGNRVLELIQKGIDYETQLEMNETVANIEKDLAIEMIDKTIEELEKVKKYPLTRAFETISKGAVQKVRGCWTAPPLPLR